MYNPCKDHCLIRFNRFYTEDCNDICSYAKLTEENQIKNEIIEVLLQILEDEHEGMRAFARNKIKELYEVEI